MAIIQFDSLDSHINFTCVHCVVFAEMFWNKDVMTNAENQIHKFGN